MEKINKNSTRETESKQSTETKVFYIDSEGFVYSSSEEARDTAPDNWRITKSA